MTNGSGVENTKLIRYMFSLQPEAFKLYHFVRVNIHFGNLAFRRYMVTILVMFYLQVKNLMPSIEDVQAGLAVKTIGGVKSNWSVKIMLTFLLHYRLAIAI